MPASASTSDTHARRFDEQEVRLMFRGRKVGLVVEEKESVLVRECVRAFECV